MHTGRVSRRGKRERAGGGAPLRFLEERLPLDRLPLRYHINILGSIPSCPGGREGSQKESERKIKERGERWRQRGWRGF